MVVHGTGSGLPVRPVNPQIRGPIYRALFIAIYFRHPILGLIGRSWTSRFPRQSALHHHLIAWLLCERSPLGRNKAMGGPFWEIASPHSHSVAAGLGDDAIMNLIGTIKYFIAPPLLGSPARVICERASMFRHPRRGVHRGGVCELHACFTIVVVHE